MKHILLMTLGTTPQVVTETLYALQQQAFWPSELHLITTKEGQRQVELRLQQEGHLPALCQQLQQNMPVVVFHLIGGVLALDDIRSEADNAAAANTITEVLRQLTADENSTLQVSLAGGRKTMGFYLGYGLSLFGRVQDRLSHVLVNAPFESLPDFFYPPTPAKILALRDGKTATTLDARITLAEIPFVRLRGLLDNDLVASDLDYSQMVERTQSALLPRLILRLSTQDIYFADNCFQLSSTHFLLLYWIALRKAQSLEPYRASESCKTHLKQCAKAISGSRDDYAPFFATNFDDRGAFIADDLRRHISRLNKALKTRLGPRAFKIESVGKHGSKGYALLLDDIQIRT
jgi:CRISPR-associated protein (TIGR02584 family)